MKGRRTLETSAKHSPASEMQTLQPSEMQAVSGGVMPYTDLSGMPDRSVMCGTMWLQQKMLERFFPTGR